MGKNLYGKRSVVVTLFLCCLLLACSIFLSIKTEKMLCDLAAVSVQTSTAESKEPETTSVLPATTVPAIEQIQNTVPVTEKAVTAAKQVNTTKAATTTITTEKHTEISPILVLNTNTKKIHSPDCAYAQNIKAENRAEIQKDELPAYEQNGYMLCGHCKGCAK